VTGGVYILGGRIVFAAAILCGALRWLARDEADYSVQKCVMVVAPVIMLPLILVGLFMHHMPPVAALVLALAGSLALAVYLVKRFCWVPLTKAIAAVTILAVGHALVGVGLATLNRQVHKPVRRVAPAESPAAHEAAAAPAAAPVSEAERLLTEVRQRMLERTALSGPLLAVRDAVAAAPGITAVAWRFLGEHRAPTLAVELGLGADGERAVDELVRALTESETFRTAGWEAMVTRFIPARGARTDQYAFMAAVQCRPVPQPASGEAYHGGFRSADVDAARALVLPAAAGGYGPEVSRRLAGAARDARVAVSNTADAGIRRQPSSEAPSLAAYRLLVGVSGSLDDVLRLVNTLETSEPLLQVRQLQSRSKTQGGFSIDIEWPIWLDPDQAGRILDGGL